MFSNRSLIAASAAAAVAVAGLGSAQPYTQVADLPTLLDPGTSGFLDTVAVDGDEFYVFGRSFGSVVGSGDSLTKFDAALTPTVLINDTEWGNAASNQLAGFYGARVVGDNIVFVNFFDNTVYSVNKNSGAISTVAAPAGTNLTSNNAVASDGTVYAYDGTADEILAISPGGVVTTAVTNATLTSGLGTDLVSGGFEVVGTDLYVARDSTNAIIAFDLTSPGDFSTVIDASAVETVTVDSDGDIDFEDIFFAPDGLVYFFEDDSDAIISFDPANPAGTVTQVLSLEQLNAGPGTSNVDQFGWYDGQLAWTDQDDRNDAGGFFVVPEPATAALLAIGAGLIAVRRRRA
ncbi:MAG: PEP-CTERM sorting domain-containing protein [Planctomycetota bacterium]